MQYPTLDQIEAADHLQLARWDRYLPSPGSAAVGRDDFHQVATAEQKLVVRIVDRFEQLGGMTTAISKAIGWDGVAASGG